MGRIRKEEYLSEGEIEQYARELRKSSGKSHLGLSAPKSGKTVLLVLDVQRYFIDKSSHAFVPSAPVLIPRILNLIAAFQKTDNPIILTRHVNDQNNAGMMRHWWRDLIVEDDPNSQIIPELSELNLPTIVKSQYDAFYNTKLDEMLREHNVTQVVITGVMTHLCCETTARSAFMHGYSVLFPVDGTATYNEEFHRATLLNLSHGFAHVVTVEEVVNYLNNVTYD